MKQLTINVLEDKNLSKIKNPDIGVGTWVTCKTSDSNTMAGYTALCLIAQVDPGIATMIAIAENSISSHLSNMPDANRMVAPFAIKGSHQKFNADDIAKLTKNGEWELTKVNVDISIFVNDAMRVGKID